MIRRAEELFGVRFPCAPEQFKQAYRAAALKYHPDHGGSAEVFREMFTLYETIRQDGSLFKYSNGERSYNTLDGSSIADLGKGLGPTKNGVPCSKCEGKGYTTEDETRWVVCKVCDSRLQSIHRILLFRLGYSSCRQCRGLGEIEVLVGTLYYKCFACKGTGEIELWNPVLKKGTVKQ